MRGGWPGIQGRSFSIKSVTGQLASAPSKSPRHIHPSRADQRAPLRQGALGEGHSGLWQRSDARGRPAPLRLRRGTGWPAGGPALSRLPVAFPCPSWLALQMVQSGERSQGSRSAVFGERWG